MKLVLALHGHLGGSLLVLWILVSRAFRSDHGCLSGMAFMVVHGCLSSREPKMLRE